MARSAGGRAVPIGCRLARGVLRCRQHRCLAALRTGRTGAVHDRVSRPRDGVSRPCDGVSRPRLERTAPARNVTQPLRPRGAEQPGTSQQFRQNASVCDKTQTCLFDARSTEHDIPLATRALPERTLVPKRMPKLRLEAQREKLGGREDSSRSYISNGI